MEDAKSCCTSTACCGSTGCCRPQRAPARRKHVAIEFLYLDLETCTRCQGTETVLAEALADVGQVLDSAGYDLELTKTLVDSEEQATALRFVTSPTIRVNSQDIQMDAKESACDPCFDISGTPTGCRVWVYDGVEYDVPPKAQIIAGVMREVFSPAGRPNEEEAGDFELPENLRRFFAHRNAGDCCSGADKNPGGTGGRCC